MQSFGEYIRNHRKSRGLLLREVAASLQIDPSLLSRIERGSKRPLREQVIQLASILKADENEMMVHYLSDRVVHELKGEKLAVKAMLVAEKKIEYHAKGKRKRK